MFKRLFLITVLLTPAVLTALADEATIMVTTLTDGSVKGSLLTDLPAITYPDTYYNVEEKNETWKVDRSEVQKYWFCTAFTLNDTVASQTVTAETYKAAKLIRTLEADSWNAFCIPFALSAEQVTALFGEGTLLRKYSGTDTEYKILRFDEATEIEAGVAYMVKPTQTVVNPTLLSVTTTAETPVTVDDMELQGVYDATTLTGTNYVIGGDGTVSAIAEGETLLGMRAYIKTGSTEEEATQYRTNLEGEPTTAISGMPETDTTELQKVYTVGGQYVGSGTKRLPKGVYVVNGNKVVVK